MMQPNTSAQGVLRDWRQGPVAVIELCRPEKANAYNAAMISAFETVLDRFENDAGVRVIVVSGSGDRSFCAGADLNEMGPLKGKDALNLRSAALFGRLERYPKICIAAVNGAAVAGGMELALSCDLRVAAERACFSLPEPRLGLVPAAGGLRRLAEVVGKGPAKEMILGGTEWPAARALQFGLVSEVLAYEAVLPRALQWAESIAEKDALALTLAKRVFAQPAVSADELALFAEALLYEIKSKD